MWATMRARRTGAGERDEEGSVRTTILAALVAVLTLAFGASSALASHAWGNYHWARSNTGTPLSLRVGDNLTTSTWKSSLALASTDWSQSAVLDTTVVPGQARGKCRPTSGRIEVCNDAYGNNGWLGVAQIWLSSGHIVQATTKVNDTYFNTPKYNTATWRNHVMCQEVGHDFGLGHQDESGADFHTCMDYASAPDADNEHPNQHDYDQLVAIYNHGDGYNSSNGTVTAPGASGAHVVWLTPSHSVEYLGAGFEIHTHVFWNSDRHRPGHDHTHAHAQHDH